MAITTLDGLIAAAKQRVQIVKTASRTSVGGAWFSVFDQAGNPGAGTLAGTSTTTGVVPTSSATNGVPRLNAFGGGATGYVTGVEFASSVTCRVMLFDLLWKAGPYAFNANTSANTPASYASRVPGGTDFTNTEIWLEQVTAGTLVQNVNVTYINQSGTAGRSTGTVATAVNIVGRMWQLPLQAGDSGVQGVTGVVGSVASAGTFNILVLRPLWVGRVIVANFGDIHDYLRVGMPAITAEAALGIAVLADSTATGLPEMMVTIANG
jgi:hypothetical protein